MAAACRSLSFFPLPSWSASRCAPSAEGSGGHFSSGLPTRRSSASRWGVANNSPHLSGRDHGASNKASLCSGPWRDAIRHPHRAWQRERKGPPCWPGQPEGFEVLRHLSSALKRGAVRDKKPWANCCACSLPLIFTYGLFLVRCYLTTGSFPCGDSGRGIMCDHGLLYVFLYAKSSRKKSRTCGLSLKRFSY